MISKKLAAFLGAALIAGLLTGCRDFLHPEGPRDRVVTFNLDGGNIDGKPGDVKVSVKKDDSVGDKMPTPHRETYTFDGWYTERNGAGNMFTDSTQVNEDITVYAKWTVAPQYTVTFALQGGNINGDSAQQTRQVYSGSSLGANMPPNPSKEGYIFGGWFTSANGGGEFTNSMPITADITIYAKWFTQTPSNLSFTELLIWITNNAIEGGDYTITLNSGEFIAPQSLSYNGKKVSVTLNGGTAERMVILGSSGSLFTVGGGVTLTLRNNISLQGRSDNTASLVQVDSGGMLVMESGSKLSGNTNVATDGGGVYVNGGGTFTQNGGTINGNSTRYNDGGGVVVSGTFTQRGGTISGNSAQSGGGVRVDGGTFTQSGGTISGNSSGYGGGGVYVYSGMFTQSGGTISGNTTISYSYGGGGVFVSSSGVFMMSGGEISGNTASYGGGVFVYNSGTFIKQLGGIIYGSNADAGLKNTADSNNYGHAVYVYNSSSGRIRNGTADSGVRLNSGVSGSAGGWE